MLPKTCYEKIQFSDYFKTDLPNHWSEKRLGFLAAEEKAAFVDGPFGSDLKSSDYIDEGVPLIQLNNIRDSKHLMQNMKFVSEEKKQELFRHIAIPGDIVIAKMADPVARAAIVIEAYQEYVIVADCVKFTPNLKLINLRYLVWAINCDYVRINAELVSTGTTRVRINLGELKKLKIPYPTGAEQMAIANFLDHETAKIDTLIEKQQQLIQLLKEKRQAVISHAVTKGLNPDVPMKDSGVEWLGEVPEHWEVKKLKHVISSLESGVSVNAADVPAQSFEYGVLKTSCVYTRSFRSEENKTVLLEEVERLKCPVRKGAIVISRMNTPDLVGASALVLEDAHNLFLPDRLWQTVFKNPSEQNSKYIAYFMMTEGFRKQISLSAEGASTSMQNIAKEDYLSINILLPDALEQESIVNSIDQKVTKIDSLIEKQSRQIELMQERRTALISAAVTGKIDVRLHASRPTGSA